MGALPDGSSLATGGSHADESASHRGGAPRVTRCRGRRGGRRHNSDARAEVGRNTAARSGRWRHRRLEWWRRAGRAGLRARFLRREHATRQLARRDGAGSPGRPRRIAPLIVGPTRGPASGARRGSGRERVARKDPPDSRSSRSLPPTMAARCAAWAMCVTATGMPAAIVATRMSVPDASDFVDDAATLTFAEEVQNAPGHRDNSLLGIAPGGEPRQSKMSVRDSYQRRLRARPSGYLRSSWPWCSSCRARPAWRS
jgi:hypothetical protein